MDFIQQLSLFGLVFSFFFGQLFRITIFGVNFPAIDIFIIFLAILNFIHNRRHVHNKNLLIFVIYSWINLIVSSLIHRFPPILPAFYLLRLTALLSFFIFYSNNNLIPLKLAKFFELALISNIIFGLIQYIFWPDLTYFKSVGWDDHLHRLVSTFFDPTFTGLIYLLYLIHLIFQKQKNWWLISTTFVAIALTYSRSTYLSLLVSALFIATANNRIKVLLVSLALLSLTVLLLPRLEGEGTRLERTSSIYAKIENFKEGWHLFQQSPLIGHGYNNLVNIRPATPKNLHSLAGFDSSLLTILVTTGIIGLFFFGRGLVELFMQLSLANQTMWVAVLIHSLFANSLLYPWVLTSLVFFKYRK